MTARHLDSPTRSAELGLIEAPAVPGQWLWAFTCPTPDCGCRTALLLASPSGRETLLKSGKVVADAWLGGADYPARAEALQAVTAFTIDLDTREVFPPVGAKPIDPRLDPAVKAVVAGLTDDTLEAIARVWHLGKGEQPPPEPGSSGATIEVEGWHPGDPVVWDSARQALHRDIYVFGEHLFEALELYCVEPGCTCGDVIVDFGPVAPRGAPHPGHVKFDGAAATLHPEGRNSRLPALWAAYQERHPDQGERFAKRSSVMHGLAGRIAAEPPKVKVGRNERCPCCSGKKFKVCCGAS